MKTRAALAALVAASIAIDLVFFTGFLASDDVLYTTAARRLVESGRLWPDAAAHEARLLMIGWCALAASFFREDVQAVAASFVVFHEFLLFQKTYLFKDVGSDSINIFYPHVALLLDYLRDVGFPSWSFRQGMGQNVFVGTGDPLLLLFYAFGRNNIGFAIAYAEVVKIATRSPSRGGTGSG